MKTVHNNRVVDPFLVTLVTVPSIGLSSSRTFVEKPLTVPHLVLLSRDVTGVTGVACVFMRNYNSYIPFEPLRWTHMQLLV